MGVKQACSRCSVVRDLSDYINETGRHCRNCSVCRANRKRHYDAYAARKRGNRAAPEPQWVEGGIRCPRCRIPREPESFIGQDGSTCTNCKACREYTRKYKREGCYRTIAGERVSRPQHSGPEPHEFFDRSGWLTRPLRVSAAD
jgi:hypothetical protein